MSLSAGRSRVKTIAREVSLEGISLHSGEKSIIAFSPGKSAGIQFVFNGIKTSALAENVSDASRGTSIGNVQVVEHVLSALSGLGIFSVIIKLSASEPPAMDGSALPFANALISAGIKEIDDEETPFTVLRPIKLEDGGASISAEPFDGFEVRFMVEFQGIGRQEFVYKGDYLAGIAPARTFGYIEEIENLKSRRLGLGASLENALVLSQKGFVNSPRFEDEPVRHKILDLIGDLALVGRPVKARIIADKSGHKLNVMLAQKIREQTKEEEK